MERHRILAAVSSASLPLLAELIGEWCELVPVVSVDAALSRAQHGDITAVVAGLHFDGSRMPLLVEGLKTAPATRAIPVLCCRLRPTLIGDAAVHAVRQACEALGVEAFIDVVEVRRLSGAAAAREALAGAVRSACGVRLVR